MPVGTLKQTARSVTQGALSRVPLGFWERLFPKDVIALGYHIVSDESLPHLKYYPYKSSAQFAADVRFITEHGRAVDYAAVAAHRLRGEALPPRAFLFTFDDGFAECFDVIRPILRDAGASGVFFVTTGFLDDRALFFETRLSLALAAVERLSAEQAQAHAETFERSSPAAEPSRRAAAERRLAGATVAPPATPPHRALMLHLLALEQADEPAIDAACASLGVDAAAASRQRPLYLTTDQVRTMAAEGFTIGGHGLHHRALQRMSAEAIEREVVESCAIVRDLTGQKTVPFAFPYHGVGLDRGLLAGIRQRHPFVELFFDTQDLRREQPFLVDRVWTDPPPASGEGTNLPALLCRAWSRRAAWFRAAPAARVGSG